MIGIDPGKPRRLANAFSRYVTCGVTTVNYQLSLDHADLAALVAMGPSARRITPQALAARIRDLPEPATVTADVQIRVYRRVSRRGAPRSAGGTAHGRQGETPIRMPPPGP